MNNTYAKKNVAYDQIANGKSVIESHLLQVYFMCLLLGHDLWLNTVSVHSKKMLGYFQPSIF